MGTTFICNDENIASIEDNLPSLKEGQEITIHIQVVGDKWVEEIKNLSKEYRVIEIKHRLNVYYHEKCRKSFHTFVFLEEIIDYTK
jgi:hypothetical protein